MTAKHFLETDRVPYLYLTLCVVLADAYVIESWVGGMQLCNVLLALYAITQNKIRYTQTNKRILPLVYVFFLYLLFMDFIHGNEFNRSIASIITASSFPILLVYFDSLKRNIRYVVYFFKCFVLYNCIFCVLQLVGVYITAGQLLAHTGFFGTSVDEFVGLSETQGLRTTGAYGSTIWFASLTGIATIVFYYLWRARYSKSMLRYLAICVLMLITTQTRSALYFIIPSILIAEFVITRRLIIKHVYYSLITCFLIGFALLLAIPILKEQYPRVFLSLEEDGSIIHRIQANVYTVVGTYNLSPLIGLPMEQSKKAMNEGYKKLGLFIGNFYFDEVTHHNQPAYYFRYYGLIGLILFALVYITLFRFVLKNNRNIILKRLLFTVLLFHFIYTLSHNNKITHDYYVWIVAAVNFNYKVRKV